MDDFWKSVAKKSAGVAAAGVISYKIYPLVLESPYLKNLTHTELLIVIGLIVLLVFGLCLALVNVSTERSPGNNTVNIKGSTVYGNVRAGNNISNNVDE
jgi:hypothetical protein